ncbi:hypothetical protein FGO68_gene1255 [Halteria grandinella]|uniref:Uncharacterized protein n=1 Tax=Halteria grandinella TaxID=5974 RepID=A0A8J8NTQ7_HALGN|nr:hypothetical protein FGO68_gene1255 [Halteria grandinella]
MEALTEQIGQQIQRPYFPNVQDATRNLRIWSIVIIKVGPDERPRHTTLPPFMMHHHFEHILFIFDLSEAGDDYQLDESLVTSLSEFVTIHTQLHQEAFKELQGDTTPEEERVPYMLPKNAIFAQRFKEEMFNIINQFQISESLPLRVVDFSINGEYAAALQNQIDKKGKPEVFPIKNKKLEELSVEDIFKQQKFKLTFELQGDAKIVMKKLFVHYLGYLQGLAKDYIKRVEEMEKVRKHNPDAQEAGPFTFDPEILIKLVQEGQRIADNMIMLHEIIYELIINNILTGSYLFRREIQAISVGANSVPRQSIHSKFREVQVQCCIQDQILDLLNSKSLQKSSDFSLKNIERGCY